MRKRGATYRPPYVRQNAFRPGFLVDVVRALGQRKGDLQILPRGVEPPGREMRLTEVAQGLDLLVGGADQAGDVEGVQEVPHGLLGSPRFSVRLAQTDQCVGLTLPVAQRSEFREGLLVKGRAEAVSPVSVRTSARLPRTVARS